MRLPLSKACGVSLYPPGGRSLLVASTVLASGLFAFDYYYVPAANRRQEALRDEIKARPKSSWLRPDRKWIKGVGSRIYYYRYFDAHERMMEDVNVFDLDPATFRLMREIVAARARWNPALKTWVFEDGWSAQFVGSDCKSYAAFRGPLQPVSFPTLTEPPDYFLKEATQDKEMNFLQLDHYIADLTQSGFGTTTLRVQFYRKFSMLKLFALIMSLIAAPFGFMVGNRGAMARHRSEYRDCDFVPGAGIAIRKARRCQSAAALHGRMVAGLSVFTGGSVSDDEDAQLTSPRKAG